MMTEEEILNEQIRIANKAESAHTGYLADMFAKHRLTIFNRFSSSTLDPDELLSIKHAQIALDNLENVILSDIESGKLAKITLNKVT